MPEVPEAPALDSALAKLRQELGPETLGELPERLEAAGWVRSAEMLEVVRVAVAERNRLRIDYYAASSASSSTREIDPEEVFHAIGNWYVVAWDHRSDQERLFRVDRIRSAEPTGVGFEPRGLVGAGRTLYSPSQEDVDVRLVLHPDARWVAEYYELSEAAERSDGTLEVVLPARHLEWVERLLLRLSGDVEVLAPAELGDRVRDLARRTREPYG